MLEYIRYTERKAITQPFEPSNAEQQLYESLNEYLQRDDTCAFPSRHRHLSLLIIRKLLASSYYALLLGLQTGFRSMREMGARQAPTVDD